MSYDPAARFVTALACGTEAGITKLLDGYLALSAAIGDVRCAGEDIEADCAIQLLAIHCGRLVDGQDIPISFHEHQLRQQCAAQLASYRAKPLLALIASRNIAFNPEAKRAFHIEGRRAMTKLAEALGLHDVDYRLTTRLGSECDAGGVALRSDNLYIGLTTNYARRGTEVQFRRVRSLFDDQGGPSHYASISELLDPVTLAATISETLGLAIDPPQQTRLFG